MGNAQQYQYNSPSGWNRKLQADEDSINKGPAQEGQSSPSQMDDSAIRAHLTKRRKLVNLGFYAGAAAVNNAYRATQTAAQIYRYCQAKKSHRKLYGIGGFGGGNFLFGAAIGAGVAGAQIVANEGRRVIHSHYDVFCVGDNNKAMAGLDDDDTEEPGKEEDLVNLPFEPVGFNEDAALERKAGNSIPQQNHW